MKNISLLSWEGRALGELCCVDTTRTHVCSHSRQRVRRTEEKQGDTNDKWKEKNDVTMSRWLQPPHRRAKISPSCLNIAYLNSLCPCTLLKKWLTEMYDSIIYKLLSTWTPPVTNCLSGNSRASTRLEGVMHHRNDIHASKPDERQQHSRMCFKAPLAASWNTQPVHVTVFLFYQFCQMNPYSFITYT